MEKLVPCPSCDGGLHCRSPEGCILCAPFGASRLVPAWAAVEWCILSKDAATAPNRLVEFYNRCRTEEAARKCPPTPHT